MDNEYKFPLQTVLTLIFLTLKLCKVITWSWWWVFSPLWIPLVILLIALAINSIQLFMLWLDDQK